MHREPDHPPRSFAHSSTDRLPLASRREAHSAERAGDVAHYLGWLAVVVAQSGAGVPLELLATLARRPTAYPRRAFVEVKALESNLRAADLGKGSWRLPMYPSERRGKRSWTASSSAGGHSLEEAFESLPEGCEPQPIPLQCCQGSRHAQSRPLERIIIRAAS